MIKITNKKDATSARVCLGNFYAYRNRRNNTSQTSHTFTNL